MTRKTNPEIIAEFAGLITEGAKQMAAHVENETTGRVDAEDVLNATKPWRTEIWKKLKECEERMCPRPPDRSGSENCP